MACNLSGRFGRTNPTGPIVLDARREYYAENEQFGFLRKTAPTEQEHTLAHVGTDSGAISRHGQHLERLSPYDAWRRELATS